MIRAALVLTFVMGCSSCEDETPQTPPESEGEQTPVASEGHVGTVRGVVRLAPSATLPEYTLEELHGPQWNTPWAPDCSPPKLVDRTPVRMTDGRVLQNVMVSATGDQDTFFAALPTVEPVQRQITIEDCRLTPAVVTATRGDSVVVTNETNYAFLPTMGEAAFMQALPEGQSREFALERGGINTMQCGFSAPCARADIIVVYHPVHGTTGADGAFVLDNVPADQPIVLHAWHPLFEDASVETRVAEGGEVTVEFVLQPKAAPPPAPDPSDAPSDPVI